MIIVNARKKEVTSDELTFEQVVAFAFDPVPPNSLFTVTYSGGVHHQDGILQPGQKVKIKERMEFNVTETGQS
jgi:Multiubiquitin